MLRASPGPRPGLSATEPGAGLTRQGWPGFVVCPDHRQMKAHKVRSNTRHLADRLDDYQAGRISFGEFDASVQGWINHVRYAATWGLREHVLGGLRFTRQP